MIIDIVVEKLDDKRHHETDANHSDGETLLSHELIEE